MLKKLIKTVKNAYLNAKFEKGDTKYLGKSYIIESEDSYDFIKVAIVKDNREDATCLVVHTPKKPEPDDTRTDTGKYKYSVGPVDVHISYTDMSIYFTEIPLSTIKACTEITNDEFNSSIENMTKLLMSLNVNSDNIEYSDLFISDSE